MNWNCQKTITHFLVFLLALCSLSVQAEQSEKLTLAAFIESASQNDTQFESILIDRMALQYRRDALLPTKDLILSLKQQFHLYLNGIDGGASSSISLQQLFPDTGTTASASYNKFASATNNGDATLQLLVSQPIAQNAFGRNYKMQDQLIGMENEVSRYQIIEAYEDYLASLTTAWYNWYSAYENLNVSRSSYASSEKLLQNILERQRQKIALPIDVNKMKLSLIGKRENIVVLQDIYENLSNLIFKAMRLQPGKRFVPAKPDDVTANIRFDQAYKNFVDKSRTYEILRLLEQKSDLAVKTAADNLLPSTNLLLGYQLDAEQWGFQPQQNSFFAGISVDWPIKRTVERARYNIAKVERKKTTLSNQNKFQELETNLSNLYLQIQRERKLMDIAASKITLAESILKDESENYSFGKVSLNDYIKAVNDVDENRFSHTDHNVKLHKLMIEWNRLTDKLLDDDKQRELLQQ